MTCTTVDTHPDRYNTMNLRRLSSVLAILAVTCMHPLSLHANESVDRLVGALATMGIGASYGEISSSGTTHQLRDVTLSYLHTDMPDDPEASTNDIIAFYESVVGSLENEFAIERFSIRIEHLVLSEQGSDRFKVELPSRFNVWLEYQMTDEHFEVAQEILLVDETIELVHGEEGMTLSWLVDEFVTVRTDQSLAARSELGMQDLEGSISFTGSPDSSSEILLSSRIGSRDHVIERMSSDEAMPGSRTIIRNDGHVIEGRLLSGSQVGTGLLGQLSEFTITYSDSGSITEFIPDTSRPENSYFFDLNPVDLSIELDSRNLQLIGRVLGYRVGEIRESVPIDYLESDLQTIRWRLSLEKHSGFEALGNLLIAAEGVAIHEPVLDILDPDMRLVGDRIMLDLDIDYGIAGSMDPGAVPGITSMQFELNSFDVGILGTIIRVLGNLEFDFNEPDNNDLIGYLDLNLYRVGDLYEFAIRSGLIPPMFVLIGQVFLDEYLPGWNVAGDDVTRTVIEFGEGDSITIDGQTL